ncbi:MAG TPA: hypothetical protein ENG40_01860 [Thermoprotei archaeon]|nr:hypothetical protein [Thermoprotei archaeon]
MNREIYVYDNLTKFLEYIDNEIEKTERRIEELKQRYSNVEKRAQVMMNIEETFRNMLGVEIPAMNEIDLMGVKIVVGARAIDEVKVYREVLDSLNERLEALRKAKKILEPLVRSLKTGEIGVIVETLSGIPERILLKESIL